MTITEKGALRRTLPKDPGNPTNRDTFWQSQSYKNVSRETFWYDLGQKSYNASDSGPSFNLVRSIDFLVQFQKRGGGASMALAGLREVTPM